MKKVFLFLNLIVLSMTQINAQKEEGLYVKFTTTRGVIVCKLEEQKAPLTVCNFVALAEGKMKNV